MAVVIPLQQPESGDQQDDPAGEQGGVGGQALGVLLVPGADRPRHGDRRADHQAEGDVDHRADEAASAAHDKLAVPGFGQQELESCLGTDDAGHLAVGHRRSFFCDRGNPDVRKVTQGLEVARRAFGGRCRIPGRCTVLCAAGAGYQRSSGKKRYEHVAIKRHLLHPLVLLRQ